MFIKLNEIKIMINTIHYHSKYWYVLNIYLQDKIYLYPAIVGIKVSQSLPVNGHHPHMRSGHWGSINLIFQEWWFHYDSEDKKEERRQERRKKTRKEKYGML